MGKTSCERQQKSIMAPEEPLTGNDEKLKQRKVKTLAKSARAFPDSVDFQIGDARRKYEVMKKQGRCPYDSFKEFLDSLLKLWEE